MSIEIIKFGFTSGELAPAFYGRPDLEKFDFGLAKAYNWFVDFRGGLTSRPGFRFHEFLKEDDKEIMMYEFRFNTDLGNTYNLIFGHEYIRFVQDGVYITETAKTPTAITKANPGVVTSNAHGYANGDWLKLDGIGGMTELNGRTVVVAGVTANTFQLTDHNGVNINTTNFGAFTAGGNLRRIYTITSPYDSEDVAYLCVSQYRDRVDITHAAYAPRTLERIADTNWVLALTTFGAEILPPTGLNLTSSDGGGDAGAVYAVTSINIEGEESVQSLIKIEDGGPDFDAASHRETVKWNLVTDAKYYNVYRSLWSFGGGAAISGGEDLGYIGRTFGTQFIDNNILADFTKTPPLNTNPFAPQQIEFINVTADGSGYLPGDTIALTDAGGGTGFRGNLIVDNAGNIAGVQILNGGSGYVTPVAVITTAAGTGATFTFTITPATGMWPSLNTIHQQRKIYAASDNDPLTLWGSKPSLFDNMDASSIIAENDAYEFELDSGDLTPIKHIMAVRGGLLCLTESGIWVVNGGSESSAITPTNVLADPHTFIGCADVRPLRIDTDLIYVEHKGFTVRELAYNDFSKLYSGNDISILSNHLFSKEQEIQSWTYAADPYKLIWGAKADGKFLSLTIVKDQKVYAWTEHGTKGLVERFLTLEEDGRDVVYSIVKRFIDGRWVKYLESMVTNIIDHPEDSFVVDSGLTNMPVTPAAELVANVASGAVSFTASAAVFTAGDVGKVLRMAGGKAEITAYSSTTLISGTWIRNPTKFVSESMLVMPAASGEWSLDAAISSVSGLHHLEGESVQVLVDGNRQEDKVVTSGRITLDTAGTRVCAGLGYQSIARTLPLTINGEVVEGRRKRVPELVVRMLKSRGLQVGVELDKLYYFKERKYEPAGEPTDLQEGERLLPIKPVWDDGGQLYFFREDPTPVSILGYVTSTEVGDDPQ